MAVNRDIGPTQRNPKGVCYRKDGGLHAGSVRAHLVPRTTPYFFRCTQAQFLDMERLINEFGFRARADFFAHSVEITGLVAEAANDLGYADRDALVRRALEALGFLEKRWPMPDWARFEDGTSVQPTPRLDKPAP